MTFLRNTLPLLIAVSSATFADEDAPQFAAEAEFGAILTSGNTDSTALKGKLDIKQELAAWRTNYIIEALYKKDQVDIIENGVERTEDQTTADKLFMSAQGDYKLNEDHRGLFIYSSYENDKFSGYNYQGSIAAGYSDRIFKTDNSLLKYSIGPGYSVYEEDVIPTESESSFILRAALNYSYNFSENTKFTQLISTDHATGSDKNSKTRSETALTAKIKDNFALKTSITVTHNSEVPVDKENTDTQMAVTLVYSF